MRYLKGVETHSDPALPANADPHSLFQSADATALFLSLLFYEFTFAIDLYSLNNYVARTALLLFSPNTIPQAFSTDCGALMTLGVEDKEWPAQRELLLPQTKPSLVHIISCH